MMENNMMLIDIGILLFLVFLIWSGYRHGFLLKLVSVLGFVVVGLLSWWLSEPLAKILALYPKDSIPLQGTFVEAFLYDQLNRLVIFVVLFVILNIVVLCLKPILKFLSDIPVVSLLNKIAGACLGGIQAVFLLFLASLVLSLPMVPNGANIIEHTLLRYCEPSMDLLMFYAKEPLQQISVLFDMMDRQKALSKQEVEDIRNWLVSQNIEEEQVNAILASLIVNDER